MGNKNADIESVKNQLDKLLLSWETGDISYIDQCVYNQPFIYMSMFGKGYSPRNLKDWFKRENERKLDIFIHMLNHVAVIDGQEAYQYATILGMYENKNDRSDHIAFGGSFTNKLIKTDGKWMLETIRFDMQSDDGIKEINLDRDGIIHKTAGDGNRRLIDGWLTWDETVGDFMEKLPGTVLPQIVAEEDAPWYMTEETNRDASDENQIKDAFYKYCFCNDFNSFKVFRDIFTENATVTMEPLEKMKLRDATAFLKEVRRGSVRSYHGCSFNELVLDGQTATAKILKYAPEAYQRKENDVSFVQGTYNATFEKVKDDWKISSLIYAGGEK